MYAHEIFNKTITKKKKSTRTIVWVKIKSYATIVPLSIFSLGKGRELLRLKSVKNFKITPKYVFWP